MLTICFVVLLLLFSVSDLYFYPLLQRATAAGSRNARARYHLIGSASLWVLAGCAIALVAPHPRPWSELRLDIPSPLRLAAGCALVIAYMALVLKQRRGLIAKPDRLRAMMRKHPSTEALIPHTPAEVKTFAVLSVSAGVGEEILYRGFLLWLATTWIGLWPAVLVTSALFGVAHAYLGPKHIVRVFIGGIVFCLLAIGSASLLPAILLHVVTDLVSGDLGYRAYAGSEPFEEVRHEGLGEAIGNGADGAALLVE